VSICGLRKAIVDRDAASARTRLNRFTGGLCHLSLDAATVHGNAVLDIILLRAAPNEPSADYFLFGSISVIEFYSSTVATAIEKLAHDRIQIRSIVRDDLFLKLQPSRQIKIQQFKILQNILSTVHRRHLLCVPSLPSRELGIG
jgi:hypothetical protein